MATELTKEEIEALDKKFNNPDSEVKCPRCGNIILYKGFACGCTAYCKTEGCIKGSVRGI